MKRQPEMFIHIEKAKKTPKGQRKAKRQEHEHEKKQDNQEI